MGYFKRLCPLFAFSSQPLPTSKDATYVTYNKRAISNVSVGCQNVFKDTVGTQQALAVLIRTPDTLTATAYAPLALTMLLKRAPLTTRTTISDMFISLYADDRTQVHNPGLMVGHVVYSFYNRNSVLFKFRPFVHVDLERR